MITKIIIAVTVIIIILAFAEVVELNLFNVTNYEFFSDKLEEGEEVKIAVLADLHTKTFGKNNLRLIKAIREANPSLILIPGDIITAKKVKQYHIAKELVEELVKIAPVYFSLGNNESKADELYDYTKEPITKLINAFKEMGVKVLRNESVFDERNKVKITGLELPLYFYTKGGETPALGKNEKGVIKESRSDSNLSIMMAHDPYFTEDYLKRGADITVSGHYHGGLVCLPGGKSVISPEFKLFPKYSAGAFSADEGRKCVYVSRGLGTHTVNIRIFNRAEVLLIKVKHKF